MEYALINGTSEEKNGTYHKVHKVLQGRLPYFFFFKKKKVQLVRLVLISLMRLIPLKKQILKGHGNKVSINFPWNGRNRII